MNLGFKFRIFTERGEKGIKKFSLYDIGLKILIRYLTIISKYLWKKRFVTFSLDTLLGFIKFLSNPELMPESRNNFIVNSTILFQLTFNSTINTRERDRWGSRRGRGGEGGSWNGVVLMEIRIVHALVQ